MKKFDHLIEQIDKEVDRRLEPWYRFFARYFIIFSSVLLSLMFVIFVFKAYYEKPYMTATVIESDIKALYNILRSIDKTCNILSIKEDRVMLNFFTVEKFAGSEIGGLNLAYPEKWKGPYLSRNLSFQQRSYELVRAQDGFFIIPGFGSKLPNGYVVGKDFYITRVTSLAPMLEPGGYLFYKKFAFARIIDFKIGDWDSTFKMGDETLKDVNSLLKEFNSALPLSQNEVRYQG